MRVFYSIGIRLYTLIIGLAAIGNKKARAWIEGRKNWKERLKNAIPNNSNVIWFHASSLGEFEQGRPLIEKMKQKNPDIFILLTFFSPSGFEVRKNYELADHVMYLPADTMKNAGNFVKTASPQAVIFIKYEFWFNYIHAIYKNNIPLYSVSTIFRSQQIFFQKYGKWFLKHLRMITHFFVQNKKSAELLKSTGINHYTISGDTRYDRVKAIAQNTESIPVAETFASNHFTLVAGSSWPEEHELLINLARETTLDLRIIIAPHELQEKTYHYISANIKGKTIRLTQTNLQEAKDAKILIIDTMGQLAAIYRYGNIALIGGGFGKGIHNILEPAVYGIPVLFGPNYHKFHEAKTMVEQNVAFPINNYNSFEQYVKKFAQNQNYLKQISSQITAFIDTQLGATDTIIQTVDIQTINKDT